MSARRRRSKPLRGRQPAKTVNRVEGDRGHVGLPIQIQSQLRALSSRVLQRSIADGTLRFIILVCGILVVQGALDWVFDLSRWVRLLFLMGDALLIGILVYQYGFKAWQRRLGDDAAALMVERHWPTLQTSLISAVQLARRPDGSPELVRELLLSVSKRVAALDFREVAPWRPLAKLSLTASVAVTLTAGLVVWLSPGSLLLMQRILLSDVPLPTQTVVAAISKDFAIPAGESIELSAMASGVIPQSGRVEVTYDGKKPEILTLTSTASDPRVFSIQLANIQQPFTYRIYLNDGRGEIWSVSLIHPPVLEEIGFEVEFPPYSEMPAASLPPENLRLLAGSKLTIVGKSSQSLSGASLIWADDDTPVHLAPAGEGRKEFRTQIQVPTDGAKLFSIELRNDDDVASQNNTQYTLEVVPDRPPEISIAEGQPDQINLIPDQNPRLRFDVRDDFDVTAVSLCIQPMNSLGEGERPDPENAIEVPIAIENPASGMTFDYEWDAIRNVVDWSEGQSFAYWIKAVDNNDVTGPGVTYSSPRQWSVVSLQTRREELAGQLRQHAESIKDLSGAQENVKDQLGNLLKNETQE